MNSDLGLNPATAGNVIRVPLPPLTEENRRDLARHAKQEAENGRIAIRNIRRDAIADIRELVKEKEATEDERINGVACEGPKHKLTYHGTSLSVSGLWIT